MILDFKALKEQQLGVNITTAQAMEMLFVEAKHAGVQITINSRKRSQL